MCGPSSAMKSLNKQITSFSGTMVDEAKTIFGDASSMFQTISGAVGKIITGGPSQQGWGAAESAAVTGQIINAAATAGRNVKSAIGSVIGAIGGGNTVAPSGAMSSVVAGALENVENQKTQQLGQATIANYEQGNKNWQFATDAGLKAPGMMTVANDANKNAMGGLQDASTSQAGIDKANNWWQPLVMNAIGTAEKLGVGALTGGTSLAAGAAADAFTNSSLMAGPTASMAAPQGAFPGSVPNN